MNQSFARARSRPQLRDGTLGDEDTQRLGNPRMTLRYPIRLEPDEDTVLATCPSLPEVTTFGENEADALRHARDAVEEALAARISDGKEIPTPAVRPRVRTVALPALTAIKVEL